MRYAIVPLLFLTVGCSRQILETAVASLKEVAAGLHPQAGKPREATPEAKPIPQDDAKLANQKRGLLEWHLRTSVGAYDKVGKRSPRWDDLARKAVDLAVRQSFEPGSKVTIAEVNRVAKAAMDAGCDDPLVANLFTRSSNVSAALDRGTLGRLRRDTTWAYAASQYPAFRRSGALEGLASELLDSKAHDDAGKKESEKALDSSLNLLAEGARSDERNGFWVDKWHDTVINIIADYRKLGVPAEIAYERADAKMANIPELEEMRLLVRGTFWFNYGWEARTNAFASDVPASGFSSLEERLAVAKNAFEAAWKLRPDNAYAAVHLMDIDKSLEGDRTTMELWFDRAMRADGDRRNACLTKLDWLDPKWHGSAEEMLAFGRACRDTKNWRAGITLLVADAHWRIACMPGENQNTYLALPEVWADIQSVYDEYLKHYPDDVIARSKFATFCHLSTHWRDAEVQYVALGDHLTQWSEFPFVPLSDLKKNRERNARIVLGKEGRITFPGWHFVRSTNRDGEWHINFPVHAEHQEKPGILGADKTHVWQCSAGGISYGLRVVNLPPARQNESPEQIMNAARSLVAKERGAEPGHVRDTLLAARPAKECDVEAPGLGPKQLRVKTVVIGNWLFELSVTANKGELTGANAREFFDSFAYQPR